MRVFNTNTFIVDAAALLDLDFDWTYFVVEKKVDGRPAIQFERLVGELTSALRRASCGCRATATARGSCPVKDVPSSSAAGPRSRGTRHAFWTEVSAPARYTPARRFVRIVPV